LICLIAEVNDDSHVYSKTYNILTISSLNAALGHNSYMLNLVI